MSVVVGPVRAVVTDIEGTTTPIAFVKETLFPYARARLATYCARHAQEPQVAAILRDVAAQNGIGGDDVAGIAAVLQQWMDRDLKAQPLKDLQGLIWEAGYRNGDLRGALFDDVAKALHAWHGQGLRLAVYSSGSVLAQKLLFGTTAAGDLTPLFTAFFDTATGAKRDTQSYRRIAQHLAVASGEIVFLSDVAEELDAAADAGMIAVHVVRPTEGTIASGRHHQAASLADIVLRGPGAQQRTGAA